MMYLNNKNNSLVLIILQPNIKLNNENVIQCLKQLKNVQ